jgi:hypothetical protein
MKHHYQIFIEFYHLTPRFDEPIIQINMANGAERRSGQPVPRLETDPEKDRQLDRQEIGLAIEATRRAISENEPPVIRRRKPTKYERIAEWWGMRRAYEHVLDGDPETSKLLNRYLPVDTQISVNPPEDSV